MALRLVKYSALFSGSCVSDAVAVGVPSPIFRKATAAVTRAETWMLIAGVTLMASGAVWATGFG